MYAIRKTLIYLLNVYSCVPFEYRNVKYPNDENWFKLFATLKQNILVDLNECRDKFKEKKNDQNEFVRALSIAH